VISIALAGESNSQDVLPLMQAYHEFEGISLTDAERESALRPLLGKSPLGGVWLVWSGNGCIGYLIACFGYSVEFCGRDAFVDEFFIQEAYRGQGIGRQLLLRVQTEMRALNIRALHLEVAHNNDNARHLYVEAGFSGRQQFMLMSCKLF